LGRRPALAIAITGTTPPSRVAFPSMRLRRSALAVVSALVMAACSGNSTQPAAPAVSPPTTTGPDAEAPPATTTPEISTVWVSSEEGRSLTEIELEPEPRVVRSVATSGPAHNVVVSPTGVAVATLPTVGRLAIVDGETTAEAGLGGRPHDVKAVGDGFVVTNEGRAMLQFVDRRGAVQGSVDLRANPHDIAVTPDGALAFATLDGSSDLAVVDVRTRTVVRYLPTQLRPHDLRFADDGRLWVTGWDGSLGVFDPSGGQLGELRIGAEAHHLAFGDDGGEVWVTQPARRISVVDATTSTVTAEVAMAGTPHHVARAGRWMVVADHDRSMAVVFDARTRDQTAEVPVAAGPHGVAAADT
jgi:DNA-binding beta-propeller fold protein YncE